MTLEGEPWFVAADVCRALGLGNSSDAIRKLDDDEKSGVIISDPHGREQVTRFISESGLYALVLSSRKPEAKAFKRWITHEVIRKTFPPFRQKSGTANRFQTFSLSETKRLALSDFFYVGTTSIKSTVKSLTLVPVGPVIIKPSAAFSA